MPQMFPLFWFSLFMLTATALFMMISCLHFSSKNIKTFKPENSSIYMEHEWKW